MTATTTRRAKPRVLLATQSELTASNIKKLLQAQFTVLEASCPETAWDLATENPAINLILCDLTITQDHFGLLERIKIAQHKTIRQLPILLLIGEHDDDGARELALRNGGTDFITAPFSTAELLARVRMHTHLFTQKNKVFDVEKDESAEFLQSIHSVDFFESRLAQELSFSTRHQTPMSVSKLEIDDIAHIQEKYGQKIAHKLIKVFAHILQKTVRSEDTLCYSGQGRFTLLYPATNALGALSAIKRVQNLVDKTDIKLDDKMQLITFSGAIYTCLACEKVSVDKVQQELTIRLKEASKNTPQKIITTGHKPTDKSINLSIEYALTLIEKNKVEALTTAHCKVLTQRIVPLLQFSDAQLNLGLEQFIGALEKQLTEKSST